MTTMTPEQRMARAHEIFAQVWGDDGGRKASAGLGDAAADVHGWGEYLTGLVAEQPEEFNGKGFLDEVGYASRELIALAERLRTIEQDLYDERGAA